MSTSASPSSELNALLRLIDDPDPSVQRVVDDRLRLQMPQIIPDLEAFVAGTSNEAASSAILDIIRRYRLERLHTLVRLIQLHQQREDDVDLWEALTLLNAFGLPTSSMSQASSVLDQMALEVHEHFIAASPATDLTLVLALQSVMFEEYAFQWANDAYDDPRCSYLTTVIERRTGLPLALSIIELLVAERVGIDMQGIALPFHFVVYVPSLGLYLDPSQQGTFLSVDDVAASIRRAGLTFDDRMLTPARNVEMILRMLRNLARAHERSAQQWEASVLRDALRVLSPNLPS